MQRTVARLRRYLSPALAGEVLGADTGARSQGPEADPT